MYTSLRNEVNLCLEVCIHPRSKCSASAAHWQYLCSAALLCTAQPLKCIFRNYTAELHLRVKYIALQEKCIIEVHQSVHFGALWCTGNMLHFNLGCDRKMSGATVTCLQTCFGLFLLTCRKTTSCAGDS